MIQDELRHLKHKRPATRTELLMPPPVSHASPMQVGTWPAGLSMQAHKTWSLARGARQHALRRNGVLKNAVSRETATQSAATGVILSRGGTRRQAPEQTLLLLLLPNRHQLALLLLLLLL